MENSVTHKASSSTKFLYCQQYCLAISNLHISINYPILGKSKRKIKAPNYDGRNKVIYDNLKIDNGHLKKSRLQVA